MNRLFPQTWLDISDERWGERDLGINDRLKWLEANLKLTRRSIGYADEKSFLDAADSEEDARTPHLTETLALHEAFEKLDELRDLLDPILQDSDEFSDHGREDIALTALDLGLAVGMLTLVLNEPAISHRSNLRNNKGPDRKIDPDDVPRLCTEMDRLHASGKYAPKNLAGLRKTAAKNLGFDISARTVARHTGYHDPTKTRDK